MSNCPIDELIELTPLQLLIQRNTALQTGISGFSDALNDAIENSEGIDNKALIEFSTRVGSMMISDGMGLIHDSAILLKSANEMISMVAGE